MISPTRLWVGLGIAASLALVIGANWQFINLAFHSHPGCVPETTKHPAAKPEC
jgi:hypothetical protein